MKACCAILFALLLAGCGMKDECDQMRSAEEAPDAMRSMRAEDLTADERREIDLACDLKVEIGDIQGKRDCKSALSSQAVAGRQVPDTSGVRMTAPEACSFPWNK